MISPIRSLLLLFYVACFCLLVMLFSPGELSLFGNETGFDVFTLSDFRSDRGQTPPKADLSFLDELKEDVDSLEESPPDTLTARPDAAQTDTLTSKPRPELAETLREARQPIEYKNDNPAALNHFYASLYQLSQKPGRVRIVHYGDSQIEGDRISGYLRERLQRRFGGCGVGMVPFKLRENLRSTLSTESSENWKKFAFIDSKNDPTTDKLGMLASYYKFTPERDSAFVSKARYANATFSDTRVAYKRNGQVELLRFLFRNPHGELQTEVAFNNKILFSETIPQNPALTVFSYPLPEKRDYRSIKVRLASSGSPELYGFAMDCQTGVALDNVPLRGSSGVAFTKMDKKMLAAQFRDMDVKLLIVEFGVNVVPGQAESYRYYENLYYRQLRFLKGLVPDLDILVVGLSDMSRQRRGKYESYPNVPAIRNAQKRAAFRAGCAFWDLFEAMGGRNAMVSWVETDPPLGSPDYIHLSGRGAKLVGEMLYNAIMNDYQEYKKRKLAQ